MDKLELVARQNDAVYMQALAHVLNYGDLITNERTGKMTHSVIGLQTEYRVKALDDGGYILPLLSTRNINWQAAAEEIFWFCNMKDLGRANVNDVSFKYWNSWADEDGDLGHTYGLAWDRSIEDVSRRIVKDPSCRRNMVNAWNEGSKRSSLPPCVFNWQIYKEQGGFSMIVRQRSCDLPVGGPFNIFQYSLLLAFICKMSGVKPMNLIMQWGDVHIYEDQVNGVIEMLAGEEAFGSVPAFYFDNEDITDTDYKKVRVENYNPVNGKIKFPVAV